MAFIAEDGTGIAGANSLASVEFADVYHAERGNVAWAALDLSAKQQNLVKATDYAVGKYGAVFNGCLVISNQALPFPRYINGVNILLPVGIQQAIAELALISATTNLMPTLGRSKKSVQVGPIKVEYDEDSSQEKQFISASLKLCPFLRGISGAMVKLVRS